MKTRELTIQGMHCGHCISAVRKELSKLPDIEVEEVEIGRAKVRLDDAKTTKDQLAKAVEEAGYRLVAFN